MKTTSFGFVWLGACAALVLARLPASAAAPTATQVGLLDVTTVPGVDPSGASDSTAGIQNAVVQARDARPTQTLFFPPGTYLVSDTIMGLHNVRGHNSTGTIVMVGSTRGAARPLLKLKDGLAAFGDSLKPKPVVHIRCNLPGWGDAGDDASMSFRDGFRGIDLDLGRGNPGAVGIQMETAQWSFLEDVTVHARDGFAGFTSLPGRNSTTGNIRVIGGDYGFYLKGYGSLGATVVGARFEHQRKRAMVLVQYRGLAITGFAIMAKRGPVIEVGGNVAEQGNTPLLDGSIELEEGGDVFANPNHRALLAMDLYVRGAARLAEGIPLPLEPARWTQINRLAFCPEDLGQERGSDQRVEAWNLIDGRRSREPVLQTTLVDQPPRSLVARHLWARTPSFEDSDVFVPVDAALRVGPDQLQAWIDRHPKVYLPAGTYSFANPLKIPAHHQVLGVPGLRSTIQYTGATPTQPTALVETADSRDSTTLLMDLEIVGLESEQLSSLRWRAGPHSIVRHIALKPQVRLRIRGLRDIVIEGHGAGRWYGFTRPGPNNGRPTPSDPNYRLVTVRNTQGPLIFYGLNLEYSDKMIEITDSANVFILGAKTEPRGTWVVARNSRNLLILALAGLRRPIDFPLVDFAGCQDTALMGLYWPGANFRLVLDDRGSDQVTRDQFLGLYLQGNPRLRLSDE